MLVPSRTDTRWFHKYVYGKAEIRFIEGRLRFGDGKTSAPFPSMLVIYRKEEGMSKEKDDSVIQMSLFDRETKEIDRENERKEE